jgi:hypothetical protein
MTKRRPRSPPDTSNRARSGGALFTDAAFATVVATSVEGSGSGPARPVPRASHQPRRTPSSRCRPGLGRGRRAREASRHQHARGGGAGTRHQHVGIVPRQIQRTPTWSAGSLQMARPALVGAHSCTRPSSRVSLRRPERCPVDVSARPGGAAGGAGRASENQPRSSSPARFVPR